ncbi:uncharacterized protein LOC135225349 [Macrobrachium nipponense]|uniref:uncharacterized protein LOC135225349 n=1 Tax=Macrobrachium nipponense TaxID=159736 RepID=UPI0030C7A466
MAQNIKAFRYLKKEKTKPSAEKYIFRSPFYRGFKDIPKHVFLRAILDNIVYHKHPHYSYHHHYHHEHEHHEHHDHEEHHHTDPKSLITEDEVKQSLQADKGEEAELTSWEVVDFTKPGDNYSNYVTSIEVKYTLEDEEHEVVYIAKVNPCKKLEGFEELNHTFFEKEVKFYTELVPELNAALEEAGKEPLQIPKFYHANLETGTEQAYYEDLRARDFKMVDRIQSLDAAHTTLILKKAGGDEKAVNWLESLKPQAFEILGKPAEKEAFAAVNHGGLWSNNCLFRYNDDGEPEEVMLLDFETCGYSSLAHDLNYLMYTSLTEEVRKEHFEEFMGTYTAAYQEIIEAAGLEMPFNEEELTEEFRENNVVGALFTVLTIPAVLLESGDLPDGATIDGEMEEILDEFWANIDEKIETSPTLKPRFLAIFEEFMESGLISE